MSFITPLPATTPTKSRSNQVSCIAFWTFFPLTILFIFPFLNYKKNAVHDERIDSTKKDTSKKLKMLSS